MEFPGKVCRKIGPFQEMVVVTGATCVGWSREFSSSGLSEVRTVTAAVGPTFAPFSLRSVSWLVGEAFTTLRMTSRPPCARLATM